jgi:hypothetical protein
MSSWIPVSDGFPDEMTPVLVVGNTGQYQYVTAAMVTWEEDDCGAGWCWNQLCCPYNPNLHDKSNYEFDDDYTYTHWMPLPTPPLQEQGE